MHVSQAELADVFGVSTRSVQRWHRDGLKEARTGPDATYDLAAAVQWRVESVRAEGDDEYRAARTERAKADAELKRLELARQRGQFLHIDDVGQLLRTPLERVDRTLKSAPRTHGASLAKEAGIKKGAAKRLLSKIVEDVRAELRKARDRNPA